MSTFLPVLNEVEKASIRERQPLPEAYLGLPDDEMALRIEAARADAAALDGALVSLSKEVSTPVPRPPLRELGDLAEGSAKLARSLAVSRDGRAFRRVSPPRASRVGALGCRVASRSSPTR